MFVDHTVESAPPASRRLMTATAEHRGYIPAAVARLAESPQLLTGFLKASGLFEGASLDPLAREVVIMTIATRNGCDLCVAMHTERLGALGADPGLVAALRAGDPPADERLDAVRVFTLALLASAGAVTDEELAAFQRHGFTAENALEVVLGIGTYTMSTLANRLVRAPIDAQISQYA